jgi:hypothetical protein
VPARALILFALTAALCLAASGPAPARSSTGCKPRASDAVVKSRYARVYTRGRVDADTGDTQRLYGCLYSSRRPLRLFEASDDGYVTSQSFADVRLAGRYVAWSETYYDISCKAACPPGYQETTYAIGLADLRGRSRRRIGGGRVLQGALFVSKRGFLAWAQPGPGASVTIRARDTAGTRELDSGTIYPASLSLRGSEVSWTKDGAPRSATLG